MRRLRIGITGACVGAMWLSSATGLAQAPPKCSQDHPGQQHRAESLAKRGDARMAESAGGHAVLYAIERYKIKDLVTDAGKNRAMSEMYDFLKWKVGSPAAVAGQWLTAGYEHFDRGYVDEAAAALLGMSLPGNGSAQIVLPPYYVKMLQAVVAEHGAGAKAYLEKEYGIPPEVSGLLIDQLVKAGTKAAGRIGVNYPKSWDIDNRLVAAMIQARRAPATSDPRRP